MKENDMPVLHNTISDDQRPAPLRLLSLAVICLTCGCFLFSSAEAQADQRVFRQNLGANPVKGQIEFFSQSTGNSGYYRLRNTTGQNRKYRIRVFMNNGKTQTRVIHAPAYGDSRSASFSYAGFNRTGIARVDLLFAKPE
jgi:hypothetical protein